MSKLYNLEYIKNYMSIDSYTCLSEEYTDCYSKLKIKCPNNHIFMMNWTSYKNNKQRCSECYGNKNKTIEYVREFCKKENYILKTTEYKNNKQKLEAICPLGHDCSFSFNNFSLNKSRCIVCKYIKQSEKFIGDKNPNWNPKREKLKLNQKLRQTRDYNWIVKNMKDDPNYNNFLNNPDDYVIDHIFPVKAFCDYMLENNIDEKIIKPIVNHRKNLQLLLFEHNSIKRDRYNKEVFINYINEHSSIKNYIYS